MKGNTLLKNVFSSDNSFEIQIGGTQFEPNTKFWFNVFYPDGSPIGAVGLQSDRNGDLRHTDGTDTIYFSLNSLLRIPTGKYYAVITHNESGMSAKFLYEEWKKINALRIVNEFRFDVPFQNGTTISIEFPEEIPWGISKELVGELMIRERISNRRDFLANKALTIKCDDRTYQGLTMDLGQISKFIEADDNVASSSCIQIFFEGDSHFKGSKSGEITFKKIKHKTTLIMEINGEKLQDLEVKGGESIILKGLLRDEDFRKGIPRKKVFVKFSDNSMEIETDEFGYFVTEVNLPNYTGIFRLDTFSEEDSLYFSTLSSVQFRIKGIEVSPLLNALMQFGLSKANFTKISKEHEQVNFIILLLTLVNFRIINLGFMGKDGEQLLGVVGTPAADLVCANDSGLNLLIDCTQDVPDNNKINKIFNSARFIFEKTRTIYLPVIITNKEMIMDKDNGYVIILDKLDIDLLYRELFKNKNIERAKKFLFQKFEDEKYLINIQRNSNL